MPAYFTATPSRRTPPLFLGSRALGAVAHSHAAAGALPPPASARPPASAASALRQTGAAAPHQGKSRRPLSPVAPLPLASPIAGADPPRPRALRSRAAR